MRGDKEGGAPDDSRESSVSTNNDPSGRPFGCRCEAPYQAATNPIFSRRTLSQHILDRDLLPDRMWRRVLQVRRLPPDLSIRSPAVIRSSLSISHDLAVGENNFIKAPNCQPSLGLPNKKSDHVTWLERSPGPAD